MKDSVDNQTPDVDYSLACKLWEVYNIAWHFPRFMSPFVLKVLLNTVYYMRVFKFKILVGKQKRAAMRAKKMGVPINTNAIFCGLETFRDLAKNPAYLSKCNSAKLMLNYIRARGKVTIDNMIISGAVFAKGDWKEWKVKVHSDEMLHTALLNQVISTYLVKSDRPEFDFKLYLSNFDYIDMYSFGVQDCRIIYVNKNNLNMLIVMRNCNEIRNGDKYWDIAKVYAQSAVYYYTLIYGHNWVHVNYPDVFVTKSYGMIPDYSVFYKLIEPHIRYVMMTNANGVSGRSTSRQLGSYFEYIRPEVPTLIPQPEFASNLIRRCITFATGEEMDVAKDLLATDISLGFPHNGYKDSDVPYLKKMYSLYLIVRKFVNVVYENIPDEHAMIERWKEDILKLFPKFEASKVNTVDFIATFIWHSALIHSIDHITTFEFYVNNGHTPMSLRKAFDVKTEMKLEEMFDPMDLCTGWCVGNSFLDYKNRHMEDCMDGLNYRFADKKLIEAQEQFKNELEQEMALNWTFNFKEDTSIKIGIKRLATSISF